MAMMAGPTSCSELFTLERLREDPRSLLDVERDWIAVAELASGRDEVLPFDQEAVVVQVTTRKHREAVPLTLSMLAFAIFVELTRFGGNVVVDRNRKPGRPAREFAKLSMPNSTGDKTSLQRILGDAQAYEEIGLSEDRGDLRPETFVRTAGGKPVKTARSLVLSQARHAAKKGGQSPEVIGPYLSNIEALFAHHDRFNALP